MQVKTYTGPTSKAVLDQIKAELGLEAVILETKTTKENGKSVVRMTAALERPVDNGQGYGGAGAGFGAKNYARQESIFNSPTQDTLSQLSAPRSSRVGASTDSASYGIGGMSEAWIGNGSSLGPVWQNEWQSIKKHIFALMKPSVQRDKLTPQQRLYLEHIEKEGASDPVLLDLYEKLLHSPSSSIMDPLNQLVRVRPWGYEQWRHRIHLVAGPYGAGKTSAAVRMALALQKQNPSNRICLVNADTDRGGGRMLLKHYAGLSDFPYREAASPIDMATIVSEIRSQGFERLIIDLPALGRGKTLPAALSMLGLNQNGYDAMAVHLVLSPQYDEESFEGILPRYAIDMEGSLIWSKLDEAERYGSILNVAAKTAMPVSSLSFGPGLKDTLVPAAQALLWRLVFRHELPGN